MKHIGGIFDNRSALGTLMGLGADAPVTKPCTFATGLYSEGAKAIQQMLVARGATKLKVDGLWGPCSESAFTKVTGTALNQSSILAQFNINCSPYVKKVVGTNCTNGTDQIVVAQPDEVTPQIDTTKQPGGTTPGVVVCPPGTDAIMQGGQVVCQAQTVPQQTPPVPVVSAKKQLIPGVPNLYLGVGVGVVVLGGLAWALWPKSQTAVANKGKLRGDAKRKFLRAMRAGRTRKMRRAREEMEAAVKWDEEQARRELAEWGKA